MAGFICLPVGVRPARGFFTALLGGFAATRTRDTGAGFFGDGPRPRFFDISPPGQDQVYLRESSIGSRAAPFGNTTASTGAAASATHRKTCRRYLAPRSFPDDMA
jgi:hypothetical protein